MPVASLRTVNAENYLIVRSASARLDGTEPVVLCAHGAGDDALLVRTRPYCGAGDGRGIMHWLADAGYIALSADFGGATPFGNDAAQAKVDAAVTWAQGTLGAKAGKVGCYGASMGALNLLNWTHAHLSQVAVLALHIPVVDLADYHDSNYGGTSTATVNTAYTNLAGYNAAKATHDPALVAADFAGIPSRIWAPTDDTISAATRTAFAAAAGSELSVAGVGGHTLATVDPRDVAAFIAQHL